MYFAVLYGWYFKLCNYISSFNMLPLLCMLLPHANTCYVTVSAGPRTVMGPQMRMLLMNLMKPPPLSPIYPGRGIAVDEALSVRNQSMITATPYTHQLEPDRTGVRKNPDGTNV